MYLKPKKLLSTFMTAQFLWTILADYILSPPNRWRLRPKKSKTISETCAKWSQFGAVSETRGLAITCYMYLEAYLHEKSLKNKKLFSLKEADVVKFFGRFYISPKIKNLKRVGSDARFNTKMQYNAIRYSSKKYALELFVALKYACSCWFGSGGNLVSRDLVQIFVWNCLYLVPWKYAAQMF